jgi:dTDP-4-amino-4,6-dideoxygalactose transaminase
MQVKYLNLPAQFDVDAILADIRDELKLCRFILGPAVKEFESAFAKICQTNYALGLNSGTDALFLALKALNIGAGDEVITVPNSFIAGTAVIASAGARPVFVDVDEEYNMDVKLIERSITSRTRAIMPVHLTGNPADMPKIMDIAKKYNLFVIEDAAQSIGAMINDKRTGSFGEFGCFSLHPLKNLNVWGDGGMITMDSEELCEKIVLLRNHGLKNRDEVEILAYNSRLDTIQAIVGNHVIKKLPSVTEKRIENAKRYDERFKEVSEFVSTPIRKKNVKHVFHVYMIRAKRRDELQTFLGENGIETKIHYPIPNHLQKGCRYLGYKHGDFPVCESQSREILSIPIHQHLTENEIDYVTDKIKEFYKR